MTEQSDPLFWPLLFVALIVGLSYLAVVVVVRTMSRREPGHHPQLAHGQGVNFHDASSHSTTTIGEVKVSLNGPRLPDSLEDGR